MNIEEMLSPHRRIPDDAITTACIKSGTVTEAKIGTFDPDELGQESQSAWKLLCARMELYNKYDNNHPIFKRLSFLPIVERLYSKIRRRFVLSSNS